MNGVRDMVVWARSRLANRPDSEHEQAIVRVCMLLLLLFYLLLAREVRPEMTDAIRVSLQYLSIEYVCAFGICLWVLIAPGISHPRRALGMVMDYSLMGVGLYLLDEISAPLYVILLWVTIGNGIRFGHKYLYAAILLATSTFLLATYHAPFWGQHDWLVGALAVGLIAIPLYPSSLLKALVRATEAAKASSDAKTRFLANMSHELRTPLNGIVGMSELLMATPLTDEQRESAEVIQTSAKMLQLLVDDILDISAIEAGKLNRNETEFLISDFVAALNKMLYPAAQKKGLALEVTIKPDVPNVVHGDFGHLRQVLINLLANAIKFTEAGKVSFTVSVASREGAVARLCFSIVDTGIGIPPDKLDKIFDAFEQVDSGRSRRYGGTGLGTSIAKALTEFMGGSIKVSSELDVGSRFDVEVPLEVVVRTSASQRLPDNVIVFSDPFVRHRARVRPMRVLVADDQPANLMVMRGLLEKAGHRPHIVGSGDDVLTMIEAQAADVAIIDLHMPGLSGLEVIKQARFIEAGRKRTPFVVLTADATVEARKECARAGAYAFMTKPLAIDKLLDKLAEIAEDVRPESMNDKGRGVDSAEAAVAGEDDVSRDMLCELREIGLGEHFIRKFVTECTQDIRKCIADLEAHGKAARWEDFRSTCHALKGAASNLGAMRLAEVASEGMDMALTPLRTEWPSLLDELRKLLDEALVMLRERGDLPKPEADSERG